MLPWTTFPTTAWLSDWYLDKKEIRPKAHCLGHHTAKRTSAEHRAVGHKHAHLTPVREEKEGKEEEKYRRMLNPVSRTFRIANLYHRVSSACLGVGTMYSASWSGRGHALQT